MRKIRIEITFAGLMLFVEDARESLVHVIMPDTSSMSGHAHHSAGSSHAHERHLASFLVDGARFAQPLDGYLLNFASLSAHEPMPKLEDSKALQLGVFAAEAIPGVDRELLGPPHVPQIAAHVILSGGKIEGELFDWFEPKPLVSPVKAPNILKWTREIEVDSLLRLPDFQPLTDSVSRRAGSLVANSEVRDRTDGGPPTVSILICNVDQQKGVPTSLAALLEAPVEPFDPRHLAAFAPLFPFPVTFGGRSVEPPDGVSIKCFPRRCAAMWLPVL